MEIGIGQCPSVRFAVPRKDSLHLTARNPHTQHGKVWQEKRSASRVLAALASPPATKSLDSDPFPCRSLRHVVYAALLHFGNRCNLWRRQNLTLWSFRGRGLPTHFCDRTGGPMD